MAVWILWMLCAVSLLVQESCSELTISGCKEGRMDVVEDGTYSFSCGEYAKSGAVWTVYSDKGHILFRWRCQYSSCTYLENNYLAVELLFRNYDYSYYYTSSLSITGIKRDSARILNCSSSSESAVCELRIIAVPAYEGCSVSISNWMVTGSCIVTGMYSSDNNYDCKWRENWNNEELGGFETEPVTYTAQDSRNYTKGVCSFAKPMPLTSGLYTYRMTVSPAGVYFRQTLYIGARYQVKLTHSCPEYVFEGSSINCSCSASRLVTPPALLVWEGRNDAKLLLANISRKQDQEQFTCQLKWGPDDSIKEMTSYKLAIAYGPSDALITNNKRKTEDVSETISLTCTATDVYPSAVFKWNVTCYNQTDYRDSSTCSITFTQKFESLAILCTASNIYNHQANASHVYVLSSLGNKQADTAGLNVGLIGGVVAAVLLVLIIVAVLIVYIIKRRKGILDRQRAFLGIFSDPHTDFHNGPAMSQPYAVVSKPQTQTQTQTQTQPPIRRQASPSGDMYTITNTTSSGHVVDDYAAVCGTVNNNTGRTQSPDTHPETHNIQRTTEPTVAFEQTAKPTITNNASVRDWQGTVYMNVTEVPTDSGLGVYHVVPWATMSGPTEPETSEYSVPTFSEDEYNELHFEEDRTGQENQSDTYHHLQIT